MQLVVIGSSSGLEWQYLAWIWRGTRGGAGLAAANGALDFEHVDQVEDAGEQSYSEQVAHGREEWDGEVVRVMAAPPQQVHQPVGQVE